MSLNRRWVALTLVACTFGFGCGRDSADKQKEDSAEQAHVFNPNAPVIADALEHPYTLELIDAGVEPRERLGYAERAPSRRIELETSAPEMRLEAPIMTLQFTWTGVEAAGERRRYTYGAVEIVGGLAAKPESDADAFEAGLQRSITAMFRGVAGQATGTSAGFDRMIQTRGVPTQPEIAGLLVAFAAPLPTVAVGVGAVWTQTANYERAVPSLREKPAKPVVDGPKGPRLLPEPSLEPYVEVHRMTETKRYTLVAREGSMLTFDLEMKVASDKPKTLPDTTANGRFVVSLADPLAQSGALVWTIGFAFPGHDDQPSTTHTSETRIELRTR